LFWFRFSEISVHISLLFWFWVYGETENHGGVNMWQRLLTSWQTGNDHGQNNSHRPAPRSLLPEARPHLLRFQEPLKIVLPLRDQLVQHGEPVVDISYSNKNSLKLLELETTYLLFIILLWKFISFSNRLSFAVGFIFNWF
jgi:hypothetical protein